MSWPAESEAVIARRLLDRAEEDARPVPLLGGGVAVHHQPALCAWLGELTNTAGQETLWPGGLQMLFECQTQTALLMGHQGASVALTDGATTLAEALALVLRGSDSRRVLLPCSLLPRLHVFLATTLDPLGPEWMEVDFDPQGGHLTEVSLETAAEDRPFAPCRPMGCRGGCP